MSRLSQIKQEIIYALSISENLRCKDLKKDYMIAGQYKRIYLYHIRKCGGTSINQVFLSLSGEQPPQELYDKLCAKPNYRIVNGNKVYVGFNQKLIEEGNYFYAFSQIPKCELELPLDTYTIVSLRDPIRRVFSHYKMLIELKTKKIKHPVMRVEGKWIGKNFSDFLSRIPKEHLLREVYMFSRSYDPEEAFENIAGCSYYYFVEDLSQALKELSSKLQIQLNPLHARKSFLNLEITEVEIEEARHKLRPSFNLIEKLKRHAPVTKPIF